MGVRSNELGPSSVVVGGFAVLLACIPFIGANLFWPVAIAAVVLALFGLRGTRGDPVREPMAAIGILLALLAGKIVLVGWLLWSGIWLFAEH